jgi:hypothetical protein
LYALKAEVRSPWALGADETFCRYLQQQVDILRQLGNVDEFERVLTKTESIYREINYRSGLRNILPDRAGLLARRGDHKGSLILLQEAEQISRENRDLGTLCLVLERAVSDLITLNDWTAALKNVRELQSVCLMLNYEGGLTAANQLECDIRSESDRAARLEEAMALHKKQEALCLELGDKESLQRSYGQQALILQAWGRLEEPMALLKKMEALCLELGNRSSLARCYWAWGLFACEQRDRKTEREKLAAALDIFTELNMPRERDAVRAQLEKTTAADRAGL